MFIVDSVLAINAQPNPNNTAQHSVHTLTGKRATEKSFKEYLKQSISQHKATSAAAKAASQDVGILAGYYLPLLTGAPIRLTVSNQEST